MYLKLYYTLMILETKTEVTLKDLLCTMSKTIALMAMSYKSYNHNEIELTDTTIFICCLAVTSLFVAWAGITFFIWFLRRLEDRARNQETNL